jgi:hypothetical protein
MALPQQNEFDLARKRAAQTEQANVQAQKDAIARRSAQLGGGVSGAMMKQEQIVADESAKRLADANEGIDTAQRAEDRRIREIEDARKFQTSEREASQGFMSGEALKQREYGTSERLSGQEFARGERLGGQEFAAGEAEKMRALQEAGLTGTYKGAETLQARTAREAAEMAKLEFEENKKTNAISTILSQWNSKMPHEVMAKLLGDLGYTITEDGRAMLDAGAGQAGYAWNVDQVAAEQKVQEDKTQQVNENMRIAAIRRRQRGIR